MISFSLAPFLSPSLWRTVLYLKWLVNLKVVIARTKDVRVEEIELKLERVLQAGTRSVRGKKSQASESWARVISDGINWSTLEDSIV